MTGRSHVLWVDLSAGKTTREPVPEEWRRRFLGGKGLGARYLYDELEPGVDPLGPENLLAFCSGPLSGYLPGETRYAAVTKSPLTGAFLDSYAGGTFAARLAGSLDDCLGLLVTGAASEPVRIDVSEGEATIAPATTWGDDTTQTDAAHPDAAVACIGPAGERKVSYATIASDAGSHHAGRGGAGAVMGAKQLKAVVAHDPAPEPPAGGALDSLREEYAAAYAADETGRWQAAAETLESVDFANEVGALASRGWQHSQFDDTDQIGIEAAREAAIGRENPEAAVPGGFRVETAAGESVPRGATQMTLGAGLELEEFDAVAALGELCDRLGVDVITAGNAVAWAVRAGEADLIECDVSFGDETGAANLIRAVASDGSPPCPPAVIEALRDGVDAAATVFGGDDMIPTVKSMELPAYDPRAAAGMALAYATSDRGACHRRARPIEQEAFESERSTRKRVAAVIAAQDTRSTLWSLVADDFVGDTLWDDLAAEWLAAAGLDASHKPEALRRRGERIWTLVRLFNLREGFDRESDALPDTLTNPVETGPAAGEVIDPDDFDSLLDAYYAARGWDDEGRPTAATLDRLGLASVRDDTTPLGRSDSHAADD
jgi:Aldehyde:ferredoxin oxidoreductase